MSIVTRIEKMPHPPAPEEKTLQFRNAMSRHAAAVSIVTTDGPGGRAGFAATAVCSVTDSPPTLLVCINRASSAYPAVSENGVLCINTLDERHEPVSRVFGGKTPMAERFDSATWTTMATGSPALDGALVSFDCRVARIADGGTHDILICEVDAMRLSEDGRSLVYFDRAYHRI